MAALRRLWGSVAFRLALNYGALVMVTMAVILAMFHVQTVGVLMNRIDQHIQVTANRLLATAQREGVDQLARDIQDMLRDGTDAETEIYLLLDPSGIRRAGNAAPLELPPTALRQVIEQRWTRDDGRVTDARLRAWNLSDGSRLVIGSDLQHQRVIEGLIGRAIGWGAALALLMTVGGALVFRHELDQRIGAIRRTIVGVEAGDLSRRIPVHPQEDEFARLHREINGMLDRLEHLMDGVRHVSNTIAHNLRTPLTRILLGLRAAETRPESERSEAMRLAGYEIEELSRVFDKLLTIAEVESGARRQRFDPVQLDTLATEMIEFYEPVAEEQDSHLSLIAPSGLWVLGDRDLLAGALINLLDNALKYGGTGVTVTVRLERENDHVRLKVQDNGPGVPPAGMLRLGTRFFRVHRGDLPGFGLGLASVSAVTGLHGGTLSFEDMAPGLQVTLALPLIPA